jgi:hypothetical protein
MRILDALEYIDLDHNVYSTALREDLLEFLETVEYMLLNTEFHEIALYVRGWRLHNMAEDHLFDRFIREKAYEIASGNPEEDYYNALAMRRDQLLALRDVLKEYLNVLSSLYSQNREEVVNAMRQFDLNTGIYLRAIDYEKARKEVIHAHKNKLHKDHHAPESILETEKKPRVTKTRKHL